MLLNSEIKFSENATEIEIKIVELSKDQDFNLLLIFEKDSEERRFLKFLSILYKDIFYTKTYAEARYYIESMKIFADQKYADLDTDDFEVREKKDEKGRVNHTFLCKFIKNENVYLRGFGSFVVKTRAQKTARNISKNTTIIIPAHNIPSFKPAKTFVSVVK